MPHRTDLLGLSLGQLRETLEPIVDRPFRIKQIFAALHHRRVVDFSQMTELSLHLRSLLDQDFRIGLPAVTEARTSADGTVKVLFEMADGASIEAVDIPDGRRRTFCISSQAGCALACQFCVTGYWGAGRDLTVGEIVGQVYRLRGQRDSRLLEGTQGSASVGRGGGVANDSAVAEPKARAAGTSGAAETLGGINLVFMGMGEPLLNANSVRQAIELLSETISLRRMTLSTVGILPALEEMIDWPCRPNLAISLHAPDDERRSKIMPVNRSNPLRDLMALLRKYPQDKSRKITFEYVMIRDFNDQPEAADATAQLLRGLHAKVNLIPINPDPVLGSRMVPPSQPTIQAFKERLRNRGVFTTVRKQRGDAVSGACGQLRAFAREPRGFRTPVNL